MVSGLDLEDTECATASTPLTVEQSPEDSPRGVCTGPNPQLMFRQHPRVQLATAPKGMAVRTPLPVSLAARCRARPQLLDPTRSSGRWESWPWPLVTHQEPNQSQTRCFG